MAGGGREGGEGMLMSPCHGCPHYNGLTSGTPLVESRPIRAELEDAWPPIETAPKDTQGFVTAAEFVAQERARLAAFAREMAELAGRLGRRPVLPAGQWRLALFGEIVLANDFASMKGRGN